MKVLQVIHGYPPRYNAGSEVYTQALAQALAQRNHVHVFTREENPFAPEYELRRESDAEDPRVTLHVVNHAQSRDRYCDEGVDRAFAQVLHEVSPDVVHIGHLNHLSMSIVDIVRRADTPVVMTLHDYWLLCPRGQFIQMTSPTSREPWQLCSGQHDVCCATNCYARCFSGERLARERDISYWSAWVGTRMSKVKAMCRQVSYFIAPSRYLLRRFTEAMELPVDRIGYLDYGFDHARLADRERLPEKAFVFGYIGTHIPAKGVDVLVRAFGRVTGNAELRIWGRTRAETTAALRRIADDLPPNVSRRISWQGEYTNRAIVADVFNRVDAIVVPSIWVENSPLVIHEAQQVRVPVITADAGGMAEYVRHGTNGLLFALRDVAGLTAAMQRFVDDPGFAARLGSRGYPASPTGDVPSMTAHVREVERLYQRVAE